MLKQFNQVDRNTVNWMARNGIMILRISVGIVFLWFGIVKFVPGLSPADALATETFKALTFGIVEPAIGRPIIAAWEVAIGLGLLSGHFLRLTLLLMGVQLIGAMSPLLLFPAQTWKFPPFVLTIEGQYIVKDIILIAAGIVIGATVRGGRMKETQPSLATH